MSSKPATPIVLSVNDWTPSNIRYMQPKVNDRGGKSINVISTQSNRSLHITTPLMMTWGISDFVDEKTGESDGKYTLSLNFPNDDYANKDTKAFLQKMKDFENQILDDAVKNSEAWFGEEMSREVAKHTFFPFLKYTKDKTTKKFDYTKPPSIRAKVPNYGGRWAVEIYDTSGKPIFPNSDINMTPMDFIPKKSNVACIIQCGGLWFGGKGWGLTWKLIQCVVKPQEQVSVYGKCHIQLSQDDLQNIEKTPVQDDGDEEDEQPQSVVQAPTSTEVDDSDEEAEPEPEPVAEAPKKKIIKKAVPAEIVEAASLAVEPEPEVAAATEAPKKKVVKKKVVS
jgi:hypothetical protein